MRSYCALFVLLSDFMATRALGLSKAPNGLSLRISGISRDQNWPLRSSIPFRCFVLPERVSLCFVVQLPGELQWNKRLLDLQTDFTKVCGKELLKGFNCWVQTAFSNFKSVYYKMIAAANNYGQSSKANNANEANKLRLVAVHLANSAGAVIQVITQHPW